MCIIPCPTTDVCHQIYCILTMWGFRGAGPTGGDVPYGLMGEGWLAVELASDPPLLAGDGGVRAG